MEDKKECYVAAFPTQSLKLMLDVKDSQGRKTGQQEEVIVEGNQGMSLRDWFAGMALVSMTSNTGSIAAAAACYEYADAMLAERAKKG